MKNHRILEGIVKGFASHRRISILELLNKQPEMSVEEVAEHLQLDIKNASMHIKKMAIAGLVMKRADGKTVRHKLTERAGDVLNFLKRF